MNRRGERSGIFLFSTPRSGPAQVPQGKSRPGLQTSKRRLRESPIKHRPLKRVAHVNGMNLPHILKRQFSRNAERRPSTRFRASFGDARRNHLPVATGSERSGAFGARALPSGQVSAMHNAIASRWLCQTVTIITKNATKIETCFLRF